MVTNQISHYLNFSSDFFVKKSLYLGGGRAILGNIIFQDGFLPEHV